ncbi:acetylxylan esterase [Armatimonas rosea]|uniref:Cephalosporin-C deacetylase-like acetyl esterase n=1 Tax=Armatimonas rosea TaxID=685828 RepID=A0A7W9SS99_ARMRO|nr:acetylxylan esterase [Armatimonas rosea]MBB6051911.1 cephalosporin-C deacetylase-like acetyl esterase [Armatimonas rosea]
MQQGARYVITADHATGVYRVGETVRWSIVWAGEGTPPEKLDYVVKKGGLTEISKGSMVLSGGKGQVEARFDEPGTLLLVVQGSRSRGGAVAAPEKIALSAKRPADFDAFWAAKVRELERVPANPQLERQPSGRAGVLYSKLTMDNIRGTKIRAQLAQPAGQTKLPALLIVQWAGVYGLPKNWATDRAAEGWLTLNVMPHDIPFDQPPAFYEAQSKGPLNNYPAIGNDSPETSYFLRMYLSCYRAAQYLTEHPDWDGKTLVVMGTSQGGLQSLMTAGFHPKITAALANVPAGCDMLGPDSGRMPGWPMWVFNAQGKDEKKVREAARYYDVANFASRITCPVLIGCGLIDETCPPAGIFAAANQMRGPKEVVILPISGHQNENGSQAPYDKRCYQDWLPALRQGKPIPR